MVELHIHEKHRLTPKEHRTEMRRVSSNIHGTSLILLVIMGRT